MSLWHKIRTYLLLIAAILLLVRYGWQNETDVISSRLEFELHLYLKPGDE